MTSFYTYEVIKYTYQLAWYFKHDIPLNTLYVGIFLCMASFSTGLHYLCKISLCTAMEQINDKYHTALLYETDINHR